MSSLFKLPSSLRIAVLRGGPSSEYEISLQSGATVLKHLSETHRPLDIFISRDGRWHFQGLEKSPEKILKNVDVVFNALHGTYGEDGTVQEILNHHGIPYTGSDRYPSSLAINKYRTKEKIKNLGIKTPLYIIVRQTDSLGEKATEIFNSIPHPLIVKPVSGGSSVGLKIIESYHDLLSSLEELLINEEAVLVEEYIPGKEGACAVIDNFRGKEHYSLPPIEIISSNRLFDYDAKYSGRSKEICPGNFSSKEKREMEEISSLIHSHIGLSHYSRSDFIVSPKRGVYFLEVNTLPGLTEKSLLPVALKAVGVSMKDFLHHTIGLALHKKQ